MFIGHYAVGLAAKRARRSIPLAVLFLSVQFMDLLWPVFLLLGVEHVNIQRAASPFLRFEFYDYPYSHSMAMSIVWSLAFGAVYYFFKKDKVNACIVGDGVFSHWILDFLTHKPDLPLYPSSSTLVGLGLWNAPLAAVAVESAMFIGAVWLYASSTRAQDKTGTFALWGLVGLLTVTYAASILGPPPPDVTPVAWSAMILWLLPLWAWWIERHRTLKNASQLSQTSSPAIVCRYASARLQADNECKRTVIAERPAPHSFALPYGSSSAPMQYQVPAGRTVPLKSLEGSAP